MSDLARAAAEAVVQRLHKAGYTALFAGGCVRDMLLGQTPADYDVATTATPDQVRALFGPRKTLAVGASFGVIIVRSRQGGDQIEVATFRREGPYQDGRRPDYVDFCTPEEDAGRRDFTINGLFFDPLTRTVLDYVGGQRDLQAGLIRAIGNAQDRFTEDKLRMLRAIRFAARFQFPLDPDTAQAITELAPQLTVVSAERIAQEARRMFEHPTRRTALELLVSTRLMPVLLPEAPIDQPTWSQRLTAAASLFEPTLPMVLVTLLSQVPVGAVRQVCQRWKLSNDDQHATLWLHRQLVTLDEAPHWPLHTLKPLLAHPLVDGLLQISAALSAAGLGDAHGHQFCREYLQQTPHAHLNPPPLISGTDLIQAGLHPGPRFKELLQEIRNRQLDGELTTLDQALQLVQLRVAPPDATP